MSEVSRDLLSQLSSYSPPADLGSSGSAPDKALPWSAILSLAGNIISNIWANSRNQRLAEQQNQWNIAQWQRENRYNLPSEQIKRLQAAGINPALAYADGGLMNEAAPSPDMTSAVGKIVSPVQIDPLTASQIANLDAQTAETKSKIPVNEQTALHITEQINTLKDQYASRSIDRLRSFEEFNHLLNQNNLFYATFDSLVEQVKSQSTITRVTAEHIGEQIDAQLSMLKAQSYAFESSSKYQDAQTEVAKAYKTQLDEVLKQLKAQTDIIEKQKELILKYGSTKEVLGMINSTLIATAQVTSAMANAASAILSKGQAPQVVLPSATTSVSH